MEVSELNRFFTAVKVFAAAAAAALLFLLAPGARVDAEAAVKGIDVSGFQGNINWNAVANSGVQYAMIRLGNTTYGADSKFVQNVLGANAAGIRTGVYVYTYAQNAAQAAADAQYAVAAMANLPVSFPVAIDIEDSSQSGLTAAQQQEIVNTFCSIVYNAGYHPMVYSYKNWFTTKLGATVWDHWVADYSDSCGFGPAAMWQYSSSGSIAGIAGNVDVNFCFKDYFSTIIPNGLSTQAGKTYLFKNFRRQVGMQTVAGCSYFFGADGAMVKDRTITDAQGNIIRMCKDGHVVTITAAQLAANQKAQAALVQAQALLAQAQAKSSQARSLLDAALSQSQALAAKASAAAQTAAAVMAEAQALPTEQNLAAASAAKITSDTLAAQAAAAGTQQTSAQTALTAAQTEETAAQAALAQAQLTAKAAAAAVVVPQ